MGVEAAKLISVNAIALRECTHFNFTRCQISPEACEDLGEAFKVLGTSLLEIHLSHNAIRDEGLQSLSESMSHLSKLSLLNLQRPPPHRVGALFLSNAFHHLKNLQYLILSHNYLANH